MQFCLRALFTMQLLHLIGEKDHLERSLFLFSTFKGCQKEGGGRRGGVFAKVFITDVFIQLMM